MTHYPNKSCSANLKLVFSDMHEAFLRALRFATRKPAATRKAMRSYSLPCYIKDDMRLFPYSCLLLLGCLPLVAQPVSANHARVELVAERTAVSSHHQFWVGVHFQLE